MLIVGIRISLYHFNLDFYVLNRHLFLNLWAMCSCSAVIFSEPAGTSLPNYSVSFPFKFVLPTLSLCLLVFTCMVALELLIYWSPRGVLLPLFLGFMCCAHLQVNFLVYFCGSMSPVSLLYPSISLWLIVILLSVSFNALVHIICWLQGKSTPYQCL
jgi:hypothetical protein